MFEVQSRNAPPYSHPHIPTNWCGYVGGGVYCAGMAKLDDSLSLMMEGRAQRAKSRAKEYAANQLFIATGILGIQAALKEAQSISDPEFRQRTEMAIINWNGLEERKQQSIEMLAGYCYVKCILEFDRKFLRSQSVVMRWAKSLILYLLTIGFGFVANKQLSNCVANKQQISLVANKQQRSIDLLLHRIAPANAPSAASDSKQLRAYRFNF